MPASAGVRRPNGLTVIGHLFGGFRCPLAWTRMDGFYGALRHRQVRSRTGVGSYVAGTNSVASPHQFPIPRGPSEGFAMVSPPRSSRAEVEPRFESFGSSVAEVDDC